MSFLLTRCCCGEGPVCPCSSFSFNFESMTQKGQGGTDRSVQVAPDICNMINDFDSYGLELKRLIGSATFVCTPQGWVFDSGTAEYQPNADMDGSGLLGHAWSRPPIYSLNRCTDPCCVTCDTQIVTKWLVTNDQSSVVGGNAYAAASLSASLQACFPSLPVSPPSGIYRIVYLTLSGLATVQSEQTSTFFSWNGATCPGTSVTTGSPTVIPQFNKHVGFIWDTPSMCVEGEFVGAFAFDPVDGTCTGAFPVDNDFCVTTTTQRFCDGAACCCSSGAHIYDRVSEGCLFDSGDAYASNFTAA
jgi:hypothetical protein